MSSKMNWRISDFVAHSDDTLSVALSPSTGRTLATGGEDKRVNLWLVGQTHNITSISGLTSPIESIVFNNTEDWLGAGSRSGSFRVFDLNESKVVRNISAHKASIRALDFHRYGDILASGSMDTNIKMWDVRRKGCLYTYKGHSEAINCLQFSPDGKWLVSGSSDCVCKIWDLTAAKCLADFSNHTGPIKDVQFHPKELLLAIGSADRTITYWDLEDFSLVSTSPLEASPVCKLLFHPGGEYMFSGSQDSLKVHEWEPSNQLDYLPISWGRVADMQISADQLIGVSFLRSNVSVWCVDLKQLKPWVGVAGKEKNGCPSARRRYNIREEVVPERPPTQPSGPPPQPYHKQQQQDDSGSSNNENITDNSPPVEYSDKERRDVFQSREALVRTPPKNIDVKPFLPPVVNSSVQKPKNNDFNPNSVVQLPRPVHQPSLIGYREICRDVKQAHSDVSAILGARLDVLQQARSQWSLTDARAALEVVIDAGSQSALVDMLHILNLKRSLWSLDMAILVLPELRLLFRSSTHQNYILCSITTLKLILKSFSSLIMANIKQSLTPISGIDMAREERMERCQACYSHLQTIRQEVLSPTATPLLTNMALKHKLHEAFSLLD